MSLPSESASRVKWTLNLLAIFVVCFLILFESTDQFGFQPRMITRFCYNSPNISSVNSQCVLCNYYSFESTLLGCTGTTALSFNITSGQAFCVISNCLGQIRQSPVFLGRRRRKRELYHPLDREEKKQADNNGTMNQYMIIRSVDVDIVDNEEE